MAQAPSPGGGPSTTVPGRYRAMVHAAAAFSGVPVPVVAAQIDDESGWNPRAVSGAGAQGIAQFEPGTWASWGSGSPFNPRDAFPAYARFMRSLLRTNNGDLRDALAAYNAGQGNLQAGYGYADTILSAAGLSEQAHGGRGVPYNNPLRAVRNLTPERVDQGVDYSGEGPVYALGPGKIVSTRNAGWPGGGFITERLSQGPLAGRYVYVAEDVTPSVQVGQRVDSSTVIGQMFQGGDGIETGFAAPPPNTGQALAYQAGQSNYSGDPGEHPTAYGAAYSKILTGLGAPSGVESGKPVGTDPSWLTKALQWVGGGVIGSDVAGQAEKDLSGIGGVAAELGRIATVFEDIDTAVNWFLNPTNWVRIFCGVGGAFLLGGGLVVLSGIQAQASQSVPIVGGVAAQTQGSIRLPMGIGMVGAGGILLFVAFHNLPPEVDSVGGLFGYLQERTQETVSAQPTSGGVAVPGG